MIEWIVVVYSLETTKPTSAQPSGLYATLEECRKHEAQLTSQANKTFALCLPRQVSGKEDKE